MKRSEQAEGASRRAAYCKAATVEETCGPYSEIHPGRNIHFTPAIFQRNPPNPASFRSKRQGSISPFGMIDPREPVPRASAVPCSKQYCRKIAALEYFPDSNTQPARFASSRLALGGPLYDQQPLSVVTYAPLCTSFADRHRDASADAQGCCAHGRANVKSRQGSSDRGLPRSKLHPRNFT